MDVVYLWRPRICSQDDGLSDCADDIGRRAGHHRREKSLASLGDHHGSRTIFYATLVVVLYHAWCVFNLLSELSKAALRENLDVGLYPLIFDGFGTLNIHDGGRYQARGRRRIFAWRSVFISQAQATRLGPGKPIDGP